MGFKILCVSLIAFACVLISSTKSEYQHGADVEDNEFAEFEDFDEDVEDVTQSQDKEEDSFDDKKQDEQVKTGRKQAESSNQRDVDDEFAELDEDEATVEIEDESEFEAFDPEEFEGLDGDDTIWENERGPRIKKGAKPELKIVDVPLHVRSWDKYYVEILMCFGLAVYIINFFMGKYMNSLIASGWFKIHREFLESQFELVGDDVQNKTPTSTLQLTKDSEHIFTLWCSGRSCVEGMLVELKLLKRQDLVSIIANKMNPTKDQVMLSITMEDMDPFVMAIGTKKSIINILKNMQDVVYYCVDKMRPADKYDLPEKMFIVSELWGEVGNILDAKVKKTIRENEEFFEYLHISDQFSGPKPIDQEEQPEKPLTIKRLNIVLNMHCERGSNPLQTDMVKMLPFLKMALYLADKIRKFRLSKEVKAKADKNRQKVELAYLKLTHAKRQEEAQVKKEEKEKALKERIMNEEDPDKQRKLEEIQHRREVKRKDKKMFKSKQMKVKMM